MIIHFYGDLPTILARHLRGQARIEVALGRRTSIKDLIESYDVPHTEVGRLTANGQEVDFNHIIDETERIEVYPLVPPFDPLRPTLLRPQPIPRIAFTVDINVGKLASLLRMTGFDALYHQGISDPQLAELTAQTQRILLTKDKDLLKRKAVEFGRLIREISPEQQLAEVFTLFGLKDKARPFTRCLRCNDGLLVSIPKEQILHRLEPLTIKYYQRFHICNRCHKIFWAGTHREKMELLLTRLDLPSSR